MKKTPINYKPNCCNKEKCCEHVEWGVGYIIGETITLFVNMYIHFVNNANNGYNRSNEKKNKYR